MKILFAPAHYYVSDKRGSEPSWPYYALSALAKADHEVWAICGVADLNNSDLGDSIHLIPIFGQQRSINGLTEIWHKIVFYHKVAQIGRRLINKHNIEVVHHFAPISPLSPNLLANKLHRQLPFTMGPAMAPPEDTADLATALGARNDWWLKLSQMTVSLIKWPAHQLFKNTLRRVDHLFAVTTPAAKYYQQFLNSKKISVVPAGIAAAKYDTPHHAKKNYDVILAVCYLIKRKGIDVLLTAFAELSAKNPQARLWIIGNGPEEANLKKLAQHLKISDRVRFWGFIDNKQIGKYYGEAGVFVSPTRAEPFGQTLLEAMAAGLPVVATETGGIPDIITKEVGYTFPVNDSKRLARVLDGLLLDRSKMKQLGIAARKRVIEVYDWSVIMREYENTWKELISK